MIYKYPFQFRLRSRAGEWRKLRAKLGRFADLWRAGEVELKGSVLLTDPNLSCPCLKVEGDLFVDFTSGVGRREYLNANLRRWPRSGASHPTSMALTPSGVETGHSVTTCPIW